LSTELCSPPLLAICRSKKFTHSIRRAR